MSVCLVEILQKTVNRLELECFPLLAVDNCCSFICKKQKNLSEATFEHLVAEEGLQRYYWPVNLV